MVDVQALATDGLLGEDSSFSNMSNTERTILRRALEMEMERRSKVQNKLKQIREIAPIDVWLESDYYLGDDYVNVYDYWKETIADIYSPKRTPETRINEVILSGCLIGSTPIVLSSGDIRTIEELWKEYGQEKHFWVYSVDYKGRVVIGKAKNVIKTGTDREVVKISLDSGDSIKCTPDHKFLLSNNTYTSAKDLINGDILMQKCNKKVGDDSCHYNDEYESTLKKLWKDREYRMLAGELGRIDSISASRDKLNAWWDSKEALVKRNSIRETLSSDVTKGITVVSVEALPQGEDVYDFEVEDYHNFILGSGIVSSNSLGIGKSTVALLILLRRFYELSCYENIKSMFKLMKSSSIVFLYFSLSKNQANLTGFGDMIGFLDSIPYFRENFPRNTKISSIILLPENIMMTYGSGTQHSIGMNLLGSILDEANFFMGESKSVELASNTRSSKVADLYASIMNRSKSRFVNDGGIDHSISILVSSSTHSSSFTETRINESANDPHTVIRCPTLWEVKPKNYSGKRFYVFKGTNTLEPYIVNSVDDVNQYRLSEGMSRSDAHQNGDSTFDSIKEEIVNMPELNQDCFISVPVELRKGFEVNIIKSLQDTGGVSVAPMGRLFTAPDIYNKCCVDWLYHPFVAQSIVVSTGDSIRVSDYLIKGFKFRDMHKPRFLHIDQSAVTDNTGISCVHIHDIIEEDGVKKPILVVDFMIQIVPPRAPKRIAIYKLRNFVVYLSTELGLKIGKVTYDIWNSEESRQILTEMGLNAAYLSVDRTDSAYVDTVNLMYEGRLLMYHYEPFKTELFNVMHDRTKKKVDHLKTNLDGTPGSKDVSDSLVGSVHNAILVPYTDGYYYDSIGDFMRANPMFDDSYEIMGATAGRNYSISQMIDREINRQMDMFDDF